MKNTYASVFVLYPGVCILRSCDLKQLLYLPGFFFFFLFLKIYVVDLILMPVGYITYVSLGISLESLDGLSLMGQSPSLKQTQRHAKQGAKWAVAPGTDIERTPNLYYHRRLFLLIL